MKTMHRLTSLITITFTALLFGCTTEGPYTPDSRNPSPEIENTTVILDKEISKLIAVDSQQGKKNDKGYLETFSNIRNRTNQDLTIQVQTVFRDAEGFSVSDDTPWETLVLTANETHTVQSKSTNRKSERFTVRIRMMR